MNDHEWKVQLKFSEYNLGFDLLIYRRAMNGEIFLLVGDEEIKVIPGEEVRKRTLYLDKDMLQQLSDELNLKQIKPKDAGKTEGLFEAQSSHLQDLRTLLKLDK